MCFPKLLFARIGILLPRLALALMQRGSMRDCLAPHYTTTMAGRFVSTLPLFSFYTTIYLYILYLPSVSLPSKFLLPGVDIINFRHIVSLFEQKLLTLQKVFYYKVYIDARH